MPAKQEESTKPLERNGYVGDPISRLSRDLREAAATLSIEEARYLVDLYYQMQEERKGAYNALGSIARICETCGQPHKKTTQYDHEQMVAPHATLQAIAAQFETIEKNVRAALAVYAEEQPLGGWLLSIRGIGPVLAAGLLAHIDITKAATAGAIWRFAGLDPTSKWEPGKKRPWNAALKTLCWKLGQSFMKSRAQADGSVSFYGAIYEARKEYENTRNERGANAPLAATLLPKFAKTTDAYKHLSEGKLPPAHIDARARRYAVKLFLAHYHEVAYRLHYGKMPPKPYVLEHVAGHTHKIEPPNLAEAGL